jgi:hypothetical protein
MAVLLISTTLFINHYGVILNYNVCFFIQGRFSFKQKTEFAVPECPCSVKMERYSVTGLVNNGKLVGRFPFDGNSGNLS